MPVTMFLEFTRSFEIEDCDIRLDEFEETGRKVLRVIIPDGNNIFPEDEHCMPVYRLQMLQTEDLLMAGLEHLS